MAISTSSVLGSSLLTQHCPDFNNIELYKKIALAAVKTLPAEKAPRKHLRTIMQFMMVLVYSWLRGISIELAESKLNQWVKAQFPALVQPYDNHRFVRAVPHQTVINKWLQKLSVHDVEEMANLIFKQGLDQMLIRKPRFGKIVVEFDFTLLGYWVATRSQSLECLKMKNKKQKAIRDTRIWLPEHAILATELCEAFGTTYLMFLTAWINQDQPDRPWVTLVKLRLNLRNLTRAEAVITLGCLAFKWAHTWKDPNSPMSIRGGRRTVAPYSLERMSKDWNVVNLLYSKSAEAIPSCNLVSDSQEKEMIQQAKDARESECLTVMVGIGPCRVERGNIQCKSMQTSSRSTKAEKIDKLSESLGR